MLPKFYCVAYYLTTNEHKGPYEMRHYSPKEAAEHIAYRHKLTNSTIMIAVYDAYPNLEKPRERLLEAFMFNWELRPISRPVKVLPW